MGRLSSPSNLPSHNKAIISFFTIVPAAAMAAAAAMDDAGTALFNQKVPLLCWGAKQSFSGNDLGPCWVAVNCSPHLSHPSLDMHIQTTTTASLVNSTINNPPAGFDISYGTTAFLADTVYHVILSYDLTDGVQTNSGATDLIVPDPDNLDAQCSASVKAWLSFNDSNITMQNAGLWLTNAPTNRIVTSEAFFIASSAGSVDGMRTYTLSSPTVGAGPVGIPVSADYVGQNFRVKMGTIQIVTDASLDTSSSGNRHLLIKSDGTPETDFTAFDAANGKTPEVRLSGSSKIKAGVDDGTLGNFTKVGTINIDAAVFDISP